MATTGLRAGATRRQFGLRLGGLAAATLPGLAAAAETSRRDLLILARALGFMERPPTGTAELGIAYPGGSAAARAEAERVAEAFGSEGLRAGPLLLRPRLVAAESLAQPSFAALFLIDAALPLASRVAEALLGRGIATVCTDPTTVERGTVVMAVRSEPRVEIVVSRAAAQRAGVSFSSAFRMMIQER